MAIVASRAELMQLSMHAAPLPRLGLAPLVRQTELQAADLPSIVPLHSVAMDAAAARVFALHVDASAHPGSLGVLDVPLVHSRSGASAAEVRISGSCVWQKGVGVVPQQLHCFRGGPACPYGAVRAVRNERILVDDVDATAPVHMQVSFA